MFLANYADGLTDFPLPSMIDHFMESGKVAAFLCVQPPHSSTSYRWPTITACPVSSMSHGPALHQRRLLIFRREIFNYLGDGEELVEEPFHRLVKEGKLGAYRHDGFWIPMDTFKDKQLLEDVYSRGVAPWEVWKNGASTVPAKDASIFVPTPQADGEPVF